MPKRPFGVTSLLLLVLSLSVWGAIRFSATLRWWDALTEFESSLSVAYLSITGAGWGVAGGVLLSGILSRKAWARRAASASILLWLLEYWIERVFFQTSRANLPFALIGSILIFAITWIATQHISTKNFFTKSEEHEQQVENPTSE